MKVARNFTGRFIFWACLLAALFLVIPDGQAQPVPGGTLDPTTIPKYVSPLVIPPQMPMSTSSGAPAADYNIAVRQFKQQILPGGIWTGGGGLPATTVWSYGRAEDPLPDSSLIAGGAAETAPATNSTFNYPAFTIENTSRVMTKVRWINDLKDPVTGKYRQHLFHVDQTMHWANPTKANCIIPPYDRTDCETDIAFPYIGPVPMVTHVHGAHVQGNSDGYPEAWWLPAASNIPGGFAPRGKHYGQADNTNVVPGSAFFAYENTQPAATIWYHDHALGMTRLNVYAGPAGFWLIRGGEHGDTFVDDGTTGTPADGILPRPAPVGAGDPNFDSAYRATIREIPIVIQDRSFNSDGSLFYPQDRSFFDGFTGPYIGGAGYPAGFSDISAIWNPEAFFNTMVVNGTTWPKFEVAPARYRLRLLNGCDSRTLNLAMYVITAGTDTVFGTADDVITATEIPFYQIGGDQGFLPKVVKITKGFATQLPGNGTFPADTALPSADQALLMMPAERADVIVDFGGLADGTRIRLINTAPDAPFQGFPDVAADPGTTGQVMDFIVNTALPIQPSDTESTPPQNLVLPAEGPIGTATNVRQLTLNELESDLVCVEVDAVTGAVVGTLFSTVPGDPTFLAACTAAAVVTPGDIAQPMGPRQALLGIVSINGGNLTATPKRWGDLITEVPYLNSVETWEIYNTTADAHPIHLHLVGFELINREDLDASQLLLGNLIPTGAISGPLPNEMGYKDTVAAYPGQVTRIKAKFDIDGLYVWHCHIIEHEDNEMMRSLYVNADLLYTASAGSGLSTWNLGTWTKINNTAATGMVASGTDLYATFVGYGLTKWDGTSWSQLNTATPTNMVVSGSNLYAVFSGFGLAKWDGTSWSQLNTAEPTAMVASGTNLYAIFSGFGLAKWDGTSWSQLNTAEPTAMVASGTDLYAVFTGFGLVKWDGTSWSQLNTAEPTAMVASGSNLYAVFSGFGLAKWDGTSWSQLNTAEPTTMVASGPYLYATFSGYGLAKWNGMAWSQLNTSIPTSMVASGSNLYATFTGYGLAKWIGTEWSILTNEIPDIMVPGF